MTRSPPHEGKSGRNDEVSQNDLLEGTSARTRPFSFEDIMLARKKKGGTTKQDISGPEVTDVAFAQDKKTSFPEYCRQEDSGTLGNGNTSKDSQKLNSGRKSDIDASTKDDRLLQDKEKRSWEPYPKLKSAVDKNISKHLVTEGKIDRFYHSDSKNNGFLFEYSDNGTEKKQARGSTVKEKVPESNSRKSDIERKQLHHEDRQVSRKRRIDSRMSSDSEYEYKKRNSRDVLVEKLTDRGRDKSEKENKHKHHNEENRTRGRSTGTKHDSGKKNLESSHAYLEESRSKRRRSRSRDRARDRGGRSRSHSPKVHKHTIKDKRDHDALLTQSVKDRSVKEHSDVDMRISSNGSGKQYRRKTVSSSGLGGYSPRKRKIDASAKTPSPTHRTPPKRTAGWDLQPVEKESLVVTGSTLSDMHATSQNLLLNIKEFPTGTTVTPITMNQIGISPHTLSTQIHSVESIQLTQATRPMRRLYVENLPASASEKELIECINKFLQSSGVNYIQGSGPCISCIIHKEKCQALLEFLTPEDASAALSLDGLSFSGSTLKLRRPKDYITVSTGITDKSMVAVDSISSDVEDSPDKIFIGGISKLISSGMLLKIARAFGPVKAFRFEFIDDINEQCAFLEYADHSVTSKACAGLNGMKLGGKVVTVVFATPDTVLENARKLPFYGIPEHAKPLLDEPSAVLKLKNVLDPEGLLSLSKSDLEEILEDIRFECSRFGTVRSVNVARPTNSPEAAQVYEKKTTSAAIGGYYFDNNKTSEVDQLGSTAGESAQNDLESNCQTRKNENDCENSTGLSNLSVQPEDTNQPQMVCSTLSDKIHVDNPMKDGICKSPLGDGNVCIIDPSSQPKTSESAIEENPSGNELKSNDAATPTSLRDFEMKNKSLGDEDLKVERNARDVSISVEVDAGERKALDGKGTFVDHSDIFEAGSIFVEFRRAEAACMAAHCLHGRLFDGREVSVGYVSQDVCQVRFHR